MTENAPPPKKKTARSSGIVCSILRGLRRRRHRRRRARQQVEIRFTYHRQYEQCVSGVPLDPRRAENILAFLADEGLLEERDISLPRRASLRHLLGVHSPAYLESVQQPEVVSSILGVEVRAREAEGVLDLQRRMVGGTIQATRLALMTGGIGVNVGGGLHHAGPDQGMGFCVFNDIAIAIARLRSHGFREPVLVIDLDLHDGNGTREAFAADPTVHTYSVHNAHWGPTEAVASTAIALGENVEDELYLGTLLKTLPGVLEEVDPGLVVYLAGADVAADDAIGNWKISGKGVLTRDRFVTELLRLGCRTIPTVIVLGGGYGTHSWTYPARFFSWLLTGAVIEPPGNDELVLMRFRRIKNQLDPADFTTEPEEYGWRLTEEDLVGILPGLPLETRFLNHFSRHGVELLLERFGVMDLLRARGYPNPLLDLDFSHPLGHTLRLWSDPRRRELLIELRVNLSAQAVPGMEVLVLEWLLLQNPRSRFSDDRPPLPGQQHPGLGALKEVLGWLVMVCEILELDGLYYVPSHFHVAAQSRKLVRFLHPEHEAWFRAVRGAFEEVDLPDASRMVEEGRLVDAATGEPVQWTGFPMVTPVSERLRREVFSDAYEQRVENALAGLHLRLLEPAATAG